MNFKVRTSKASSSSSSAAAAPATASSTFLLPSIVPLSKRYLDFVTVEIFTVKPINSGRRSRWIIISDCAFAFAQSCFFVTINPDFGLLSSFIFLDYANRAKMIIDIILCRFRIHSRNENCIVLCYNSFRASYKKIKKKSQSINSNLL